MDIPMGLVTWVVTGAAVGLVASLVWRPSGRADLARRVISAVIGAVVLGLVLRSFAGLGFAFFHTAGIRLFTWLNVIQALLGGLIALLIVRSTGSPASRKRYRDLAIGVGITILLVVIAEVGVRSYFFGRYSTFIGAYDYLDIFRYATSPTGYGDLVPNEHGVMPENFRPYRVHTNEAGFRNTEPLNDDPSARILALGDSMTFGYLVDDEDTWPAWLQTILRQRLERGDIEVLNAGIIGYTIEDELSYFREKGHRLAPDLVILGFYTNDISDLREAQREALRRPTAAVVQAPAEFQETTPGTRGDGDPNARPLLRGRALSFFNDHVALYRLIGQMRTQLLSNQRPDASRAQIDPIGTDVNYANPAAHRDFYERYEAFLRELILETKQAQSQLVIVAIPEWRQVPVDAYPDSPQQFVREIAQDTNTPYLDLLPVFRGAGEIDDLYLLAYDVTVQPDDSDPFFPEHTRYVGDWHLSRFGYRVAARGITEFLLAEGLIAR